MSKLVLALTLLWPAAAMAQTTFTVSTEAQLQTAITSAVSGDTIVLANTITLTSLLPNISTDITFDGGGHAIDGAGQFRGLVVGAISGGILAGPTQIPVVVTIQNLTLQNTVAQGGAGGTGESGGGGAGGLGAGLFVAPLGDVTLNNVNFAGNRAVGGAGGPGLNDGSGGGGGGGLTGSGGAGGSNISGVGGTGLPGVLGSKGGDGAQNVDVSASSGGAFGGGGGGSNGFGGYGGGGGGTSSGAPSQISAYGGGSGGTLTTPGGGGGAALGGAMFIADGGSIKVTGPLAINGSTVSGGAGGAGAQTGAAYGSGIFLAGFGTAVFSSTAGQTQRVADSIADELGADPLSDGGVWILGKQGAGTLVLSGLNNYAGGTYIQDGTLSVSQSANLGSGDVAVNDRATLAFTGTSTFNQNFTVAGAANFNVARGNTATINGTVADDTNQFDFSGGLVVDGGGTLALTNALNSYSNGTAVTGNSTVRITDDGALGFSTTGVTLGGATSTIGGTLQYGTGTTLATARNFTLNAGGGTVDTEGTAAITINGVISGTGSFTKAGTGTLLLNNVNTYSGGTFVNGGTLQSGISGSLGTGGLQVNAGGTLALNNFSEAVSSLSGGGTINMGTASLITGFDNSSTLFGGSLNGTGSLFKFGTGTLTLTGPNTYTGGTSVIQGTLAGTTVGLRGGIGIAGGANVTFDQTFAGTYAGVMSGAGSVTKTGTGTVTFTGANNYTGGTTVNGGVLAGTTASLQGNILNNATVQFDQVIDGTYGANMSGTGALLKTGGGTLTLSGTNAYTGGTVINGGTLAGSTANIQGDVVDNAQLLFTQSTNGTFGGTITGNGGVTKTGGGTLTLTALNFYRGGTTVAGGAVAGTTTSLQGAFQLQSGTSLQVNQLFNGIFNGSISGSGSLVKTGTGVVLLNGSNTYTGGTSVLAGGLIGTTASLQGTILNNGRVEFNQNTNGAYSGAMSGTGSLIKSGTGALTLSGTNSYSGGTTITGGGGVSIASNLNLGAATGAVTLGDAASNGTLAFTNGTLLSSGRNFTLGAGGGVFNTTAAPVTLFGTISGSGGLTKTGTGVLEVAGTSSYTGATTVTGGTLRAGASNAFGNGTALLVGAGSAVDLNGFSQTVGALSGNGNLSLGSGTLTAGVGGGSGLFAGVISGSGSLVKTGGGALVLTGANTYSGGTSVLGGALVGDTTSLQGNIDNNAVVQFDQNSNGTYAGSMSGTGVLAKTGSGILTLAGTNTYSGGTLINGGSIIGTATSLRGMIVNNAQLTFGGASSGVFGGTLAGSGTILKTGTGLLTLNGQNTDTGLFSVAQGTLALNGSYAGSIDVASGATVRANGIIGGSLNLAGSLFAVPAGTAFSAAGVTGSALNASSGAALDGPAFLTIGQNLIASSGSLLNFAIGSGTTPTLLVGGTAAFNGSRLTVTAPSIGSARSQSFLAIAALNGLQLTNTEVTSGDVGVFPVLKQDRNSLFVTMVNLNVPLRGVATPRSINVADAIDRTKFGATGDAAFIVGELTALDDAHLQDALEQVGGQLHASVLQTAILDAEGITDLIRDQMSARELDEGDDFRWWGETACQHADFKANDRARGGTANVCAGAGGADKRLSQRWTFGGGGSFTGGSMGIGAMGSGDYTAPRAFGYVGFKPPSHIGIRGGGSAAKSNYKTQRLIQFQALLPVEFGAQPLTTGVDRTAEAEQQGSTSDQWSEVHDSRKVGTYTIEGLIGIRHARISRGSFTESGAIALDLIGQDETLNLTQTDAKIHGFRRSGSVRPFFDVAYRRELAEGDTQAPVRFSGLPQSDFIVEGINIPASSYSARVGTTFATWLGQATFTYEYKQSPGARRQSAGLRIRFK